MSWNDFGDNWLKNGLPTFHGGKDKNHARTSLDKLGGPDGFKTAITIQPDGTKVVVQTKGAMPPQVFTYPPMKVEVVMYTVKTTIDVYCRDLSDLCPTSMLRITIKPDLTVTAEFPTIQKPGVGCSTWGGWGGLNMQTGYSSYYNGGNAFINANAPWTIGGVGVSPFGRNTTWVTYAKAGPNSSWSMVYGTNRVAGENARPLTTALVPQGPAPDYEYNMPQACRYVDVEGIPTLLYVILYYGSIVNGHTSLVVHERFADGSLYSSRTIAYGANLPPGTESLVEGGNTYAVTNSSWIRIGASYSINASCTKILGMFVKTAKLNGSVAWERVSAIEVDLNTAEVEFITTYTSGHHELSTTPNSLVFGYDGDTPRVVCITRQYNAPTDVDLSGTTTFGPAIVQNLQYTLVSGTTYDVTATGVSCVRNDYNLATTIVSSGMNNEPDVPLDSWVDYVGPSGTFRGAYDYECTSFSGRGAGTPPNLSYSYARYTIEESYRRASQSTVTTLFFSPTARVLIVAIETEQRTPFTLSRQGDSVGGMYSVNQHGDVVFSGNYSVVAYNLVTGDKQTIYSGESYSVTVPAKSGRAVFPFLGYAANGGVALEYVDRGSFAYVTRLACSVSADGLTGLLSFVTAKESISGLTEIGDTSWGDRVNTYAQPGAIPDEYIENHNYILRRNSVSENFTIDKLDLNNVFAFAGEGSIGTNWSFVPYFVSNKEAQ